LCLVLGLRSSPLARIAGGLPVEAMIRFHSFLGCFLLVEVITHGVLAYIAFSSMDEFGIAATASLLIVCITALLFSTGKLYNVFYLAHFVFVLFFAYGCMHSSVFFWYGVAAGIVFAIDQVLRWIRSLNARTAVVVGECTTGDSINLRFQKRPQEKSEFFQHCLLNFPEISAWEWHPFFLTNGPDEPFFEVYIKKRGDFTKQVIKKANAMQSIKVRFDGPYGTTPVDVSRYTGLICAADGIGISAVLSTLRHIYAVNTQFHTRQPFLKDVFVFWNCDSMNDFLAFEPIINAMRDSAEQDTCPSLHIFLYVNEVRGDKQNHGGITLMPGKGDISRVFDCAQEMYWRMKQKVAVLVCGSEELVNRTWVQSKTRTRGNLKYYFNHQVIQ